MSVACLPDGKQIASAPWNTREAAEHDVYQQALMRLAPMPAFDPGKTYEAALIQRRADALLEHCGYCARRPPRRRKRLPPPKASFYPGSGGSAGIGGLSNA